PAPLAAPAPTPTPAPVRPRASAPVRPSVAAPIAIAPSAPAEPAPTRSPVDEAVETAMRQRFSSGGVPRRSGPEVAAYGTPLPGQARQALDQIARASGLGTGQLAGVGSTPRAQARLLVEKLFDPQFGEARVRAQY